MPTFVALIGAQKHLKIATLIDFQKGDQQMIENLYKKKLLKKTHVLTFADFTGKPEADIEDMFDEDFYLQLVNDEYAGYLPVGVTLTDLTAQHPRILVRLEAYFAQHPMTGGAKFSHYRPARYLAEKVSALAIPDATLERFEKAFKGGERALEVTGHGCPSVVEEPSASARSGVIREHRDAPARHVKTLEPVCSSRTAEGRAALPWRRRWRRRAVEEEAARVARRALEFTRCRTRRGRGGSIRWAVRSSASTTRRSLRRQGHEGGEGP